MACMALHHKNLSLAEEALAAIQEVCSFAILVVICWLSAVLQYSSYISLDVTDERVSNPLPAMLVTKPW